MLARRALAALRDDESVPAGLPPAIAELADAVGVLREELLAGQAPRRAREAVVAAVRRARVAPGEGGFSSQVVLAQVRSVAVDLLQATGLDRDDARHVLPPP